jgi:hypothetical protein
MGEVITGIKMLKNKFNGEAAGYCFVQYVKTCLKVLLKNIKHLFVKISR